MNITEEDYIEHFGTKGMRWGRRKARSQKSENRKVRAERIQNARKFVRSREYERQLNSADKEYFKNRKKIGRKEAEKIYKSNTQSLKQIRKESNKIKDGKEFAVGMGLVAGLLTASVLGGAVISRNW